MYSIKSVGNMNAFFCFDLFMVYILECKEHRGINITCTHVNLSI